MHQIIGTSVVLSQSRSTAQGQIPKKVGYPPMKVSNTKAMKNGAKMFAT